MSTYHTPEKTQLNSGFKKESVGELEVNKFLWRSHWLKKDLQYNLLKDPSESN